MGRKPKPSDERTLQKTISLPPDVCKKLESINERTGIPQSHIISRLITDYDEAKELGSDDTIAE